MIKYETDPIKIRNASFDFIREKISLLNQSFFDELKPEEQQIAVEMVQASGDLSILENLRFSESVVKKALSTFDNDFDLLCDTDTDTVICGLKDKYLKDEPISFINKANVITQAKSNKSTRSMVAVDLWKRYLPGSIVLIGSEPTALFRLLEMLVEQKTEDADNLPALIIATPSGFIGASEAKDYLWEQQEVLGIECITLLGTRGSNNLTTTAMNTLLKLHNEQKQKNES